MIYSNTLMKKYLLLFLISALTICITGCKPSFDTGKADKLKLTDQHNAQNSLDWAGVYSGILPCADCSGIKTKVTLNSDRTFITESLYLGKDVTPLIRNGKFTWNNEGNIIFLAGLNTDEIPVKYFVSENKINQLDMDGNFITGALAEQYILYKITSLQLSNTQWRLIELMGQPIESGENEIFINFSEKDNRVAGYAGCNNFSGSYNEKGGFRLSFGQLISTKKYCPDLKTEDIFLNMLEQVDNYIIVDDELHLHKAKMAPLAKFMAVVK